MEMEREQEHTLKGKMWSKGPHWPSQGRALTAHWGVWLFLAFPLLPPLRWIPSSQILLESLSLLEWRVIWGDKSTGRCFSAAPGRVPVATQHEEGWFPLEDLAAAHPLNTGHTGRKLSRRCAEGAMAAAHEQNTAASYLYGTRGIYDLWPQNKKS